MGKNNIVGKLIIPILAMSSVLECKKNSTKKGMPWLGRGYKIGLSKNGSKFKETKKKSSNKHTYFATYIHPILLL